MRDLRTGLSNADQDIYRGVASEVKRRCDGVPCTTTGGKLGEPVENRSQVVANPQPELASLNAGSFNFALFHVAGQHQEWKHDWE